MFKPFIQTSSNVNQSFPWIVHRVNSG